MSRRRRIMELARAVGAALRARGLVLATAESCTAGGIAYAITQIAGSSEWFDRGFVTYSNMAKQQMLGVSAADLGTFGAVSEPVARAMALGAMAASAAQVTVAVTGIAGPGGGSAAKPVGLVCFGWARRRSGGGAEVRAASLRFGGDRAAVRTHAIIAALEGLLDLLADDTHA